MQNNRQIPVDRSESNPMLLGLLELVKEESQGMQQAQQELNKAMGEDPAISGLMEKHRSIRAELQASQQKKVNTMMVESAAISALIEQHQKELVELQKRQRQELEKAMGEDAAIVEALKLQKEETAALAMHQQKELNNELNNSATLAGAVEKVKEARKSVLERQQMFDKEMFKAVYMTPVKINPEPEVDEDGNVIVAPGSQLSIQILPLKNANTKGVMMAFTDAKEFKKWDKAEEMHTVSMTMKEFISNVMRDPNLAGVAINPFGDNIIIPRDRMEMMLKAAMMQKQAMENQKNVNVVEANINE